MRLPDDLPNPAGKSFLISAGYHTPNGPLHLGHLGGPFLHGNVLARHLESLGASVAQITGTDAHESYVLLSAVLEGVEPRAVSAPNHALAVDALDGFGMHQDTFADSGAPDLADKYALYSHELVRLLRARGRTEVRTVDMLRSTSGGRIVVGPFAVGTCPDCGAEAAGTCCEACGLWFGPELLRDTRPRLAADEPTEPVRVPTVYLHLSPDFGTDYLARRFPARHLRLVDAYLKANGPWVPLSHPLGWGVPWQDVPGLLPGTVHTSYAVGTYASNRILKDLFCESRGLPDPFARDTSTTTVLASGLDAVLPCMLLAGLTDPELDWQPYRHHLINEFMLLDGAKFSTTRGHAVTAQQYLDTGLPTDLFRLYAALITRPGHEADFRVDAFAEFSRAVVAERLAPLTRRALATAVDRPGEFGGRVADSAGAAVRATVTALSLEDCDLGAAAAEVMGWLEAGESGLAEDAPYHWLAVMSWLLYPFAPAWATDLWTALGLPGGPSLDVLGTRKDVDTDAFPGIPVPDDAAVAALRPGAR
ncbi:class I tRNA ligase family protein [Yinghuangia seranimata]|uniref:class I tRNA ligase family protein n=1 Tax=Yinghuangia seranimata TaxID=408067 RepID=UPI00248CFCA1|nr:class I tRNA ligase family protein [Yinghuangia seranimata]MDI2128353.1 class I tRNA ligase family protein [Yinghuangia seranimata]